MAQLQNIAPKTIMVEVVSVSSFIATATQWLKQIPGPGECVVSAGGVLTGTVVIKGSEVTAACVPGDKIAYSVTAGDMVHARDLSYYVIKEEQFIQVIVDDGGGDLT